MLRQQWLRLQQQEQRLPQQEQPLPQQEQRFHLQLLFEWQLHRQRLFLEIAKDYVEEVEKMPSRNFNNDQCDYLLDKLKVVVKSASLFTEASRAEARHPASSANIRRKNEVFKLLVVLANQVESFVQGCCNDAWLQAAMTLTNVSEYALSIGFNLELCRVAFCRERGATQSLTLDQVVDISIAEFEIVKKKACIDFDNLIDKVILELPSLGSEEKDLASYLLQRLRSVKPIPASYLPGLSSWDSNDLGSYFGKLFTRVQRNARLGTCGSGATVDRGTWLGTSAAIKTFYGPEDPEFMHEVEILGGLCHPNITTMFCSAMDRRKCSIVMELMDEDLHALMQRRLDENSDSPPFTIDDAVDIMLQIGEGVNYLHGKGIEHRDLKSFNILAKSTKARKLDIVCVHVKVADFGLSKIKESSITYSNRTFNTGTNRWMAPEIIKLNQASNQALEAQGNEKQPKFSFKSDIYSYAMVCYEILTGELPFSTIRNPNEVKEMVTKGCRPRLPHYCPLKLKALVEKCWNQVPQERPSFSVICSELKYIKYLLMTGLDQDPHPAIEKPLQSATEDPRQAAHNGKVQKRETGPTAYSGTSSATTWYTAHTSLSTSFDDQSLREITETSPNSTQGIEAEGKFWKVKRSRSRVDRKISRMEYS